MSITRKRGIGLMSFLCVCLSACAIFALDNGDKAVANAATPTIADVGQGFDGEDYSFQGYSFRFDEEGAVNSNSVNSALRFKMKISAEMKSYLDGTSGAKTGTLIYPAYYLNGDESALTVESKAGDNGEIVPINLDTTAAWQEVEGGYESVTYLKEIPAAYYNSKIAVRGYLEIGGTYYYTSAPEARSLSYVVNQEKSAANFTAEEKAKFTELFLKFPITVDGVQQTVYYGDTLEAPEARTNEIFLHYAQGDKIFTAGESKLVGRGELTSVWAKVDNYYSAEEKTATFAVEGLPADITSAKLNGETIDCTTTEGMLTVSNLQGLAMGQNSLLTVTDSENETYYVAFKNVAKINDNVPYSAGDELAYDLGDRAIDYVENQNGEEILTDGGLVLTGIAANNTATVQETPVLITDSAGDVHKLTLRVFTKVLYTDQDAIDYFIGTEANNYTDAWLRSGMNTNCYALGADLTLGTIPLNNRFYNAAGSAVRFSGLFDGAGHTLDWTVDGSQTQEQDQNSGSLFGYYVYGVLQNVAFNVNFKNLVSKKTYPIIAAYFYGNSTPHENVFIKANFDESVENLDNGTIVRLGGMNGNYKLALKNFTYVCTYGKTGSGISRTLLSQRNKIFNSDGTALGDNGNIAVEGTEGNYTFKTEYANFSNVNFIIPDGVEGALGSLDGGKYAAAGNQTLGNSGTTNFGVKYNGTALYNYSNAKTTVTKVGKWQISYGNGIEEISATYLPNG